MCQNYNIQTIESSIINTKHYHRNNLEFDYIKPKEFEKYAEQYKPIIIGSIKLKTTDKDNIDTVTIKSNDKIFRYELIRQPKENEDKTKIIEKPKKVLGYILVSENTYVAVLKSDFIIPILLLFLFCFLLIGCIIGYKSCSPDTPSLPNLEKESGEDWDGDLPSNGKNSEANSESTQIPGYTDLYVSAENPEIQLINPEGNTVYFQYTISENDTTIFETKAIAPNKMVTCNLKELLPVGEHTLNFSISTYDIETEAACNGATQEVKLTVE